MVIGERHPKKPLNIKYEIVRNPPETMKIVICINKGEIKKLLKDCVRRSVQPQHTAFKNKMAEKNKI